jgi:hypothetical protein
MQVCMLLVLFSLGLQMVHNIRCQLSTHSHSQGTSLWFHSEIHMISHFELSVSSLVIYIALLSVPSYFHILPYLNHGMFHFFNNSGPSVILSTGLSQLIGTLHFLPYKPQTGSSSMILDNHCCRKTLPKGRYSSHYLG